MKIYIWEDEDVSDKNCKDIGINILCHVYLSWSHIWDNGYSNVKWATTTYAQTNNWQGKPDALRERERINCHRATLYATTPTETVLRQKPNIRLSHCVSMLQSIGLPVAFIIRVDDGGSRFLWNISTESSRQHGNTTHKGVISWTLLWVSQILPVFLCISSEYTTDEITRDTPL